MFDETMGIPKKEMTAVSHAHEPLSSILLSLPAEASRR
jgi:hypothetical protein